jgi:CheY-like chemotaxis protein
VRKIALIVDDDAHVRSMLVQLLTSSDFECLEADTAEAALALLDKHDPSICVLDIAMPGMSGAELAWNIRQRSPGLPLVAVSGHLDAWDPDDLSDLGFTKVYGKPFDVPEFLKGCDELSGGGGLPAGGSAPA